MRLIIAGGRDVYMSADELGAVMRRVAVPRPSVVLCGGAPGVDRWGRNWAFLLGIPVERFEAEWEVHGKAAGPIRNREMAAKADALLLVWDGKSRGSASMKREAEGRALKIWEWIV